MCCHSSKVVCKLFCVCKMFEEFCSREHRLRQDITKTHRLQSFFPFVYFLCPGPFLGSRFFGSPNRIFYADIVVDYICKQ